MKCVCCDSIESSLYPGDYCDSCVSMGCPDMFPFIQKDKK